MSQFYVALVNETRGVIEFNERWNDEHQARNRAQALDSEAAGRGTADGKWSAYFGDVPIEAVLAAEKYTKDNPLPEGATQEDIDAWEEEKQSAIDAATATTEAVEGEPPVDDTVRTRTCHKCATVYDVNLDWCPACGTRPLYPSTTEEVDHA